MVRGENKILAGVCSGIAEKYSINTLLVRVLFFVLTPFIWLPFFAYVILWILTPTNTKRDKNKTKWQVIFSIIGIILGAVIGFFGGMFFGDTILGYKGGDSIMAFITGIFGIPIGAALGFIAGLHLGRKMKAEK